LRERGHCSRGHSVSDSAANGGVVGDRKINGIGQGDCRSTFSVRTVTSCAVLAIEKTEIHDLIGPNNG
jgi:hypothetical protein